MSLPVEQAQAILAENERVLYGVFGVVAGSGVFPPHEFLNEFFWSATTRAIKTNVCRLGGHLHSQGKNTSRSKLGGFATMAALEKTDLAPNVGRSGCESFLGRPKREHRLTSRSRRTRVPRAA